MYFKLSGKIDGSLIIVRSDKKLKAKELARQIIENELEFEEYLMDSEVKKMKEYKKYYDEMHPKMILNEDYISDSISDNEVNQMFHRFFVPLNANTCRLTIIDQYIFSQGTKTSLLTDIIKKEVSSKQIRFITNFDNEDATIKNAIEGALNSDGFTVDIVYDNKLHDRWWYTRTSGFTTGISFNGLSRKESTIKMLDQSELTRIISKHGI